MMKVPIIFFSFCLVFQSLGSAFQGGWIVGWGSCVEATGVSNFKYSTNQTEMMAQYTNSQVSWFSTGTVSVASQMLSNITAISCGELHPFALKSNGKVVGWGPDAWGTNRGSEFAPPTDLNHVVAIAAGEMHNLALKKDGTIVAWGNNRYGALNIPEGLSNAVAVAACGNNSLALKSNGTVVGWGQNVKIPHDLTNVVAISANPELQLGINNPGRALALKADGRIVEFGWSDNSVWSHTVGGVSNVIDISAGPRHNLALKKDGTVYAWGFDNNGELEQPPGLTNVVAITASGTSFPADAFNLALKSDGQIVGWGRMNYCSIAVPEGLSNVVAISAAPSFCLAITTNRAVAEKFAERNELGTPATSTKSAK